MVQQVHDEHRQHIQRDEAQQERGDVEDGLPDRLVQVIRQGIDAQILEYLGAHVGLEGPGDHRQLVRNRADGVLYGRLAAGNDLRHRGRGDLMVGEEGLRLQVLVQHRHQRLV